MGAPVTHRKSPRAARATADKPGRRRLAGFRGPAAWQRSGGRCPAGGWSPPGRLTRFDAWRTRCGKSNVSTRPPTTPQLPDLTGVDRVAAVVEQGAEALDATYYDTAGNRLAADGITLRRRTGGKDAGWHLKLPVPPGTRSAGSGQVRDEVRAPLSDAPPKELTDLVRSRVRGRALCPSYGCGPGARHGCSRTRRAPRSPRWRPTRCGPAGRARGRGGRGPGRGPVARDRGGADRRGGR